MKATLQGELFVHRKAAIILNILMRLFNACKRYAYKRLLSGQTRECLKKLLQKLFGLNSRYVDDAIFKAQETLDAVHALGGKPHKVIWGGKRVFRSLCKAKKGNDREKIARLEQEWHDKRTGSLYSRGDKSKGGNLNLHIRHYKGHKFFLRVNIAFRKWIEIPFFLGKKYTKKLLSQLKDKDCLYSVEILRRDGHYFIHITLEETTPAVRIGFEQGAIGIDLNAFPAHIAWAETDAKGNLISSDKIPTPHLYDSRAHQRDWWRGEYPRLLCELAEKKRKGLVLENLDFKQPTKKHIKSRKLRRILSNFSYSSLKKAIVRQMLRNAIATCQVWPGFTSKIGKLKYQELYNLSVHKAAALVIGRRGLGYKEKLTKELLFVANCKRLVSSERGESTFGRNSAPPLAGQPVGWSLWRALYKAVLTGHSTKPSLRGSGP